MQNVKPDTYKTLRDLLKNIKCVSIQSILCLLRERFMATDNFRNGICIFT